MIYSNIQSQKVPTPSHRRQLRPLQLNAQNSKHKITALTTYPEKTQITSGKCKYQDFALDSNISQNRILKSNSTQALNSCNTQVNLQNSRELCKLGNRPPLYHDHAERVQHSCVEKYSNTITSIFSDVTRLSYPILNTFREIHELPIPPQVIRSEINSNLQKKNECLKKIYEIRDTSNDSIYDHVLSSCSMPQGCTNNLLNDMNLSTKGMHETKMQVQRVTQAQAQFQKINYTTGTPLLFPCNEKNHDEQQSSFLSTSVTQKYHIHSKGGNCINLRQRNRENLNDGMMYTQRENGVFNSTNEIIYDKAKEQHYQDAMPVTMLQNDKCCAPQLEPDKVQTQSLYKKENGIIPKDIELLLASNAELRNDENFRNQIHDVMKRERGERPEGWTCTKCSYFCSRKNDFKRHSLAHLQYRPHICEICGRGFLQPGRLKSHVEAHKGIKKYVCKVCNARFTESSSLSRHMRIHNNEMPYVCMMPGCPRKFCRKNSLHSHLERAHPGWMLPPGARFDRNRPTPVPIRITGQTSNI